MIYITNCVFLVYVNNRRSMARNGFSWCGGIWPPGVASTNLNHRALSESALSSSTIAQVNAPTTSILSDYPNLTVVPAPVRDDTANSHASISYGRRATITSMQTFYLTIYTTPGYHIFQKTIENAAQRLSYSKVAWFTYQAISFADPHRNICAQEWCAKNPGGSTAAFKQYYEELPASVKEARNKLWCYV